MRRTAAALLLACALACTRTASVPEAPPSVTDAIGARVAVPRDPKRIVSLAPAITETLFAVGAGARVAGVTRHCDYPAEAASRTQVGGFTDSSAEPIVALSPDLVIATADASNRDRYDALIAVGVPVYVVNPRDLEATARTIATIGEIAGERAAGETLAESFRARVRAVKERVAAKPKRRVLFLFSVEPLIAAGPDTFVDEVLRAAGGENVMANAPTSYPRLGVEGILASRPDVVLTTAPRGKPALAAKLGSIEVHEVDPALLERPGPRLAAGLESVARLLHP